MIPKRSIMTKKSKEPSSKISEQNPNIFNKLFGETPVEESNSAPIYSLFSSENPFRRRPEENPLIPTNPNKRNNEENPNQLLSGTPEKGKKLRVEEFGKNPNLGNEQKKRNNEESPNLSGENKPENLKKSKMEKSGKNPNLDEKKKKRKRDELERDYEAKKYGVVNEEGKEKEKVKVGKKRKAVDNPVELMAVSKEEREEQGYDDESKLLRTVFVGNLPLKVKKKGLIKEFSQFGVIDSIRIRSVPTLDVSV